MIVPVMAISNLVLTRQIYSEETNGAHVHYREPVPLSLSHRQNVNLAIKTNIYLTGFAETWLKKFQVHFNNLTFNWNGKQLKVTS